MTQNTHYMKKKIFAMTPSVLLALVASGQSSVWKVQGEGNPLYLRGTIHPLRPQDFPLSKEYEEAYGASQILIFETDIAALESPKVQQYMMSKAMYTDGRTLRSVPSEDVYQQLDQKCVEMGIPIVNMQSFKPDRDLLSMAMTQLQKKGVIARGVD